MLTTETPCTLPPLFSSPPLFPGQSFPQFIFPRSKVSPDQNFPQVKISPRSKFSPGQNFPQVDFSPGQFPLFHPPPSKPRALKSSKAVNHAQRAPFASPLDTLYFSISGHHFILPLISIALSYIIPT